MAHEEHSEGQAEEHEGGSHVGSGSKSGKPACRSDPFFDRVSGYVTGKIATFVAFLFFLISLGAVYAVIITGAKLSGTATILILVPAAVGLVAYYNRDFAIIIFVLFLIGFFII